MRLRLFYRMIFGFLLAATMSGCVVIPDEVNGTLALGQYSVQELKSLVVVGQTNVIKIHTLFGAATRTVNRECKDGSEGCLGENYTFNRIDYGRGQLTARTISYSYKQSTGIIEQYFAFGHDKPY